MILNRKLFYDHGFFEPARKYPLQRRFNIFENGVWSKVGQHKARNIIAVGLEASVLPALESMGAICYLLKPYSEDELLGCIRRALAARNEKNVGLPVV